MLGRLLGEGGDSGTSQVRLAHQRVLEAWPRARDIVAANARFFRIKPDIERAARWVADKLRAAGIKTVEIVPTERLP